MVASALIVATFIGAAFAQNKPNWNYTALPAQTEQGQFGTNQCGPNTAGPNSLCQTVIFNSADDFCLFAPRISNSLVGSVEYVNPDESRSHVHRETVVAWCLPGNVHGARTIPAQAFTSFHWVQTPNYIQSRAKGDFTQLNARRGDGGGELDPHGATGNGNPIGSLVFSTAFGGGIRQVKEWMSFVAADELCFRACDPDDPNAWLWCQHMYDLQGCDFVMPGQATNDLTNCIGDSEVAPPGVYGWTSTWYQGVKPTPPAHPAPAVRSCQTLPSVGAYASQLTTVGPPVPSSSSLVAPVASSYSSIPLVIPTAAPVFGNAVPTTSASVYTPDVASTPASITGSASSRSSVAVVGIVLSALVVVLVV